MATTALAQQQETGVTLMPHGVTINQSGEFVWPAGTTKEQYWDVIRSFESKVKLMSRHTKAMTASAYHFGKEMFGEEAVAEVWETVEMDFLTSQLTLKHGEAVLKVDAVIRRDYDLSDEHWVKIVSELKKDVEDSGKVRTWANRAVQENLKPPELAYWIRTGKDPRKDRENRSGTGSGVPKSLTAVLEFELKPAIERLGGVEGFKKLDRRDQAQIWTDLTYARTFISDIAEVLGQ